MRQALRKKGSRTAVASVMSIPAPTGGWDTESPLAAQKPKYALILDNMIPRNASCELRRGYVQHVTGTTDPVETLLPWRGDPNGDKLFAAAGTDIYDVTTAGALLSADYVSAASARWNYVNFANDAGAFLVAANGLQDPIRYDGTNFTNSVITGSSGPITLDPDDLEAVMVHKRRLWFTEKGTLRCWYLATNAIQGPANLLDLGLLAYKGGALAAIGSWSLDAGQGMDDVAVFITTEGQAIVYQGNDPDDDTEWTLVGVYDLARPIGGARALTKWGSDLAVITEDGIVPLSQALNRDRAQDDDVALTARIATAFAHASQAYRTVYGWGGLLYSGRGSLALFNIPTGTPGVFEQYVQSVQSGAWCRFSGIDAYHWELANGGIYFGAENGVYQWDIGASDNGEPVIADVKNAFSAFGSPARQKAFRMLQPIIKAPAIVRPALEMLVDYTERVPTAVPTVVTVDDIFVDSLAGVRDDYTSVTGVGYVGSPRMRINLIGDQTVSRLSIDGTDLLLDMTAGDHILTAPNLPLDVPVELIGYNVTFESGGAL
jgi:hypothetical protein